MTFSSRQNRREVHQNDSGAIIVTNKVWMYQNMLLFMILFLELNLMPAFRFNYYAVSTRRYTGTLSPARRAG